MNITKNLTTINRTILQNRKIEYIVIHYFGGLASAKSTCAYFRNINRKASAHYFVDDGGVWQCVEDADASWHCGDGGKGTFKGQCTNANSIGIEVRPFKVDASRAAYVGDTDWYFHEQTVTNLIELVKSLMEKHGIDAEHVIRHYDVTVKVCPRPWVGEDINTYYGKTGNDLWTEFKRGLEGKSMTEPIPAWKAEIADKSIANGVIADSTWKNKLDEPAPVWMVLAIANKIKEGK